VTTNPYFPMILHAHCAVIHVAFFSILGHLLRSKCSSISSVLFLVQSVSTLVLSTDLDIHFGPLSVRSSYKGQKRIRTEVAEDRSGYRPLYQSTKVTAYRAARPLCTGHC